MDRALWMRKNAARLARSAERAGRARAPATMSVAQAAALSGGGVGLGSQPGADVDRTARIARTRAAASSADVARTADARLGSTNASPLASTAIAPGGQRIPVAAPSGFGRTVAQSPPALLSLPVERGWLPGGSNRNPYARGAGPGMGFAMARLQRVAAALDIGAQTPVSR